MQPFPAFLICLSVLGLFTACQVPKNTAYFQTLPRDTVLRNTVIPNSETRIGAGDLLSIGITSASPELSALFNAPQTIAGGGEGSSGYLVDRTGNIQLYKLGTLHVEGSTAEELKQKLEKDLDPYLKDAVVTVRFVNHHITLLGEVGSPGVLPLPTGPVTLLDALGERGDLTEKARRDNILVIRQTDSGKLFKRLNLEDHSIFASPYFFLQNNDVVYVETEKEKKTGLNALQIVSYAISLVSVITFFFRSF